MNFADLQTARESPRPIAAVRSGPHPWFEALVPQCLNVTRVTLPVPNLPAALVGLRILHVTDLHATRRWGRGYDQLIELTQTHAPDILLITGDFGDDHWDHRPGLPTLRRLLPQLRARHGIYGILGNHDTDLVAPHLLELGVALLDRRRVTIDARGGIVEMIGLPGGGRKDFDPAFVRAQPPPTPGQPRVVLCHYPDLLASARSLHADLFLSGHTHGGQVCLPGGRPLITHDRLPRCFAAGIHRIGPTWLIVSRGFGFTGLPVRVFCPTEVIDVELAAA